MKSTVKEYAAEVRAADQAAAQATEAAATAQQRLQEAVAHLRAMLAAKAEEIELATTGAVPPDELPAAIDRLVSATARRWLHGTGEERLGAVVKDGWAHEFVAKVADPKGARLPAFLGRDGTVPFPFVCAADPEYAKRLLLTIMAQCPYTPGPPSKDRSALIARLKGELATIETAEEDAVDRAIAAGVSITHRPEVETRRNAEAAQQARATQEAAEQATRELALNDRHAQRAVPSPFVANRG
jgi:hypothetical protein